MTDHIYLQALWLWKLHEDTIKQIHLSSTCIFKECIRININQAYFQDVFIAYFKTNQMGQMGSVSYYLAKHL